MSRIENAFRTATLTEEGHWEVYKSPTLEDAVGCLPNVEDEPFTAGVVLLMGLTPVKRHPRVKKVLAYTFGDYSNQEFGREIVPRAIRVVCHPCRF